MQANIPKRKLADSWSLEVTTAPAPGEGSVAEATMDYARAVADGKIEDSRLFFFHRQADDKHDLAAEEGIRAAVLEASGPVAEWSDLEGIVEQWRDPTVDRAYLERVWLNRLVRATERAFDAEHWRELANGHEVPAGALVTLGFDGARREDATAIIGTEIETGYQFVVGIWEKPLRLTDWEVPDEEVGAAMRDAFERFDVWRLYADPYWWENTLKVWQGEYGENRAVAWPTNRWRQISHAVQGFHSAIETGELSHDGNRQFADHIGNAHRRLIKLHDAEDRPLWVIQKERPDSPHKIDAAMAAILSWEARADAIASGIGKGAGVMFV